MAPESDIFFWSCSMVIWNSTPWIIAASAWWLGSIQTSTWGGRP